MHKSSFRNYIYIYDTHRPIVQLNNALLKYFKVQKGKVK